MKKSSIGIDSMDQVGFSSEEPEAPGRTEEEEVSATEAIKRKYGLVVPEYIPPSSRTPESTNKGRYRSVLDFASTEELQKAMLATAEDDENHQSDALLKQIAQGDAVQTILSTADPSDEREIVDALDWVLPTFDPELMEPQTLDEEVKRLEVLQSYMVLDQDREEAFDRITQLASRVFNVPVAVINLIDLGRLWLLSTNGLGDIRECPRKVTFCAYTISCKDNIMVVPDARLDARFRENPVVTGPPHVRFYAGVALVSPEGYKLGDFCVWDSEPRPGGLTSEEQDTLRDMANMTVKVMVDRRYQLEKKRQEEQEKREQEQRIAGGQVQALSSSAQDMMAPLSGLQLSLSLLKDDDQVQTTLGEQQLGLLHAALNNANAVVRMCKDVLVGSHEQQASTSSRNAVVTPDPSLSVDPSSDNVKETRIAELIKSLRMVVAPMDTQVPLVISADKSVPPIIMADDLKIFRSALNLMASAVERTTVGMICFSLKVENGRVVFECADTGYDIPKEEHDALFQPSNVEPGLCGSAPAGGSELRDSMSMVARLVNSMKGGQYGFRPSNEQNLKGERQSGSVFWFSIPLDTPTVGATALEKTGGDGKFARKRTHEESL